MTIETAQTAIVRLGGHPSIRSRRTLTAVAMIAVLAALPAGAAAQDTGAASCAPAEHAGGEWRGYGGDLSNTRHQAAETTIGPSDVPTLTPAWTFSTVQAGGTGDITGTPTIVDGCMFVASNGGWVFAVNADTGELVWKKQLPYGGGVNSSVAVDSDRVYVSASRTSPGDGCPEGDPCVGPYAVAFDRQTGEVLWAHTLDTQQGSDTYATPVIFDGVLMNGVSGGAAELGSDEAARYAFQGAMVFLDAATGELLKKTWTIHPPGEPDDNLAGAPIWSTPSVDPETGYAYVGSGNPFNPEAQHEHTNAVLKFDVDRSRPTFGQIVDSYKGTVDEVLPVLADLPCLDFPGNNPPWYPQGLGQCFDIDLDFGASPNLFTDENGRKLVGTGQKSGIYHIVDAETMEPVSKSLVGLPTPVGGIVGSTAYDPERRQVYGPHTVGGYLWSLSTADGLPDWIAPTLDVLHWGNPVASANGVVYTTDLLGFLNAFDAGTGLPLGKHALGIGGTKTPLSLSWAGVSVARNTIYAASGISGLPEGFVVAFRKGGVVDKVGDVTETLGLGGDALDGLTGPVTDVLDELLGGGDGGGLPLPAGGVVATAPGAQFAGYLPPVTVAEAGGTLDYTNLDIVQHDVVSRDRGPDGKPLFRSRLASLGETVPVEGLDRVQPGNTYDFYCTLHPAMAGQLIVQ